MDSMDSTLPAHYTFRAVVSDQHTAARAYFLCVLGMLLLESAASIYLHFLPKSPKNATKKHWLLRVWLHRFTTLPSPAPFLTNHSLATILVRWPVFIGLNLLWGWGRIRYSVDYQRYGWLTLANAGLALLLPATHNNLFQILLRIPAHRLLAYHRWTGIAAAVHATLHFVLTAARYAKNEQLDTVFTNARIRVGTAGWAALIVIALLSLRIMRRRVYAVFHISHVVLLPVFLGAALYHASHAAEFLVPGLALWAIDRVARLIRTFVVLSSVKVRKASVLIPGDVVKLSLEGVRVYGSDPAQVAWVQIPAVSGVAWHPFTMIASGLGPEGEEENSSAITVAMRVRGGYTKKVRQAVMEATSSVAGVDGTDGADGADGALKVRVEGPYRGVGRVRWTRFPVVVLVAGGIGVTPAVSIASAMVKEARARVMMEGEKKQDVHLLWVVTEAGHIGWFAEELRRLLVASSHPDANMSLHIRIHITGGRRGGTTDDSSVGECGGMKEQQLKDFSGLEGVEIYGGRPNVLGWFEQVAAARRSGVVDVAVNVCGPQSLKDDARRAAARVSGKNGLFFVEEEQFEF